MRPLDTYTRQQLNAHIDQIGICLNADVMAIISPILSGLDNRVNVAISMFKTKKPSIAIILDTPGGIVEVVERMVNTIRNSYSDVIFIIPDRAMSAGTVFAMAGDRILMSHFSCLGPIDPQIEKEGTLIPALSYLIQFDRLNKKSASGKLTAAEYALLSKLDLGELYQFEQARELSKELLVRWLSTYKFKDWTETETQKTPVTVEMRKKRAEAIGEILNNHERWHSHGRGLDKRVLIEEIGLKVEDIAGIAGLQPVLDEYFGLINDYMLREKFTTFIHTKEYF